MACLEAFDQQGEATMLQDAHKVASILEPHAAIMPDGSMIILNEDRSEYRFFHSDGFQNGVSQLAVHPIVRGTQTGSFFDRQPAQRPNAPAKLS